MLIFTATFVGSSALKIHNNCAAFQRGFPPSQQHNPPLCDLIKTSCFKITLMLLSVTHIFNHDVLFIQVEFLSREPIQQKPFVIHEQEFACFYSH